MTIIFRCSSLVCISLIFGLIHVWLRCSILSKCLEPLKLIWLNRIISMETCILWPLGCCRSCLIFVFTCLWIKLRLTLMILIRSIIPWISSFSDYVFIKLLSSWWYSIYHIYKRLSIFFYLWFCLYFTWLLGIYHGLGLHLPNWWYWLLCLQLYRILIIIFGRACFDNCHLWSIWTSLIRLLLIKLLEMIFLGSIKFWLI